MSEQIAANPTAAGELSSLRNELAGFRSELQSFRGELTSQGKLLERIDERNTGMSKQITEMQRQMVTRPEFNSVKGIAYGLVALFMSGIVAAILNQVIQSR